VEVAEPVLGHAVDQSTALGRERHRRLAPVFRGSGSTTDQALAFEPVTEPGRRRAVNVKGRGQVSDGDGDRTCQDDERSILRQRHIVDTGE
jgi:hypothetical protein